MQEGKILAASHQGAYVIRLEGDVRLTLCTTIDEYFDKMFEDPEFISVWVDLCDAQGIDSTTLGLLAKLALSVKDKFGFQPAIYCCDAGINRLIKSMGFQRLFTLHEEACCAPEDVNAVPLVEGSEILTLVPGNTPPEKIREFLSTSDTILFLKHHRNAETIYNILQEMDLDDKALYVSRCGFEEHLTTTKPTKDFLEKPDYLSLIIVKK